MPEDQVVHVFVDLVVDEDGYPPFRIEELHAEEIEPGLARLAGIPVFAYGMTRGDIVQVEVRRSDDRPWVVAVAEQSDHWTARVVPLAGQDLGVVVRELIHLGCDAHTTAYGLVPADVPPEADATTVLRALRAGRSEGRLDFDLGVDPEALVPEPAPARARGRACRAGCDTFGTRTSRARLARRSSPDRAS